MPHPLPTIQIDTRERQPWTFANAYRSGKIRGTISKVLDAGDYTLVDFPDLVIIERKKSVVELYNNFIPIENRDRFDRELEKLKRYKHKYIIVEQTWDALYNAYNFKFSKKNASSAGNIVLGNLLKIMSKHGMHVIFAGINAEHTAVSILVKHYWDKMDETKNE